MKNGMLQQTPNRRKYPVSLVPFSHLIFAKNEFCANSGSPILYKWTAVMTQYAKYDTNRQNEMSGISRIRRF
jgi:hypothetical protein